jgi:FkbM family methyltransferase
MNGTETKKVADSSQPVTEESGGAPGTASELSEFVSVTGHKFFARPDTTDSAIFQLVVDENEYNLPLRFQPDDIVIDIGAHIGGFSYAALKRGAGKVYAFEAHPANHAIAYRNLERFGEKINCQQRAVWRSDQPSQTLYNESLVGNSNTGGVSLLWNETGNAVDTISLDQILSEASEGFRKPIRLLKIDCEGSEYPILFTSTQLQIVEEICGEYHEVPAERIPDRAKVPGKFERFDRFALKEFFEEQGWSIVLEPKAEQLGLFHARPNLPTTLRTEESSFENLMSQIREAVRVREAQGETSFINASAELFKLLSDDGFFSFDFGEADFQSGHLTLAGELAPLRLQPKFEPAADNHYHVNDLLKYHDREFIWNAYRAILKREPDERGLADFLALLRSGSRNKIDILASLHSSGEGMRAGVTVEGLSTPALIRKFYRLPGIGYLAEMMVTIARLPMLVRSQRQTENHLIAQQERITGHIAQTSHQLLEKINQLLDKIKENQQDAKRQADSLREASLELQTSLKRLAQHWKQIAVVQHQQVKALFREQQILRNREPANRRVAGSHLAERLGASDIDQIEASLTEHLRGTPDSLKKDLDFYLSLLNASRVTGEILDLGCGRGIWLQHLKESGLPATGVEANSHLVAAGRKRGLEIIHSDVIEHLRQLPEASLQAVTGFHVIEHFEFHDLLQLLAEIRRVLKPGGVVIVETPNPKNLVVGACNFYADPTHRQPLFPETLQFLLDAVGFIQTRITYLHPTEGSPFNNSEPGSRELHIWLFGPRDFAAIGRKS